LGPLLLAELALLFLLEAFEALPEYSEEGR
jgi:hypothetical protein